MRRDSYNNKNTDGGVCNNVGSMYSLGVLVDYWVHIVIISSVHCV